MKSDRILTAIFLGCLSTIAYEILTRIFVLLGYGKYSLYQLDSMIVTINRADTIIGLVVSCLVSILTSALFYFALAVIGTEHLVVKSILFSLLMWAALEIIFTSIIEGKSIPVRPLGDYYSHMAGAIVYGITQGLLLKQFLFGKS